MAPLLLSLLLSTTPPLVPGPPPLLPPGVVPLAARRGPPPPPPPAKLGLTFSALGFLAAGVWLEADVPLAGGFDLFANVGGGPFGQFGFDVGGRLYVSGSSLDGFFVDARFTTFALPAGGLWMGGPGVLIGHSWRIWRLALAIAVGTTTFVSFSPAAPGTVFFGASPVEADVLALPGFTQPFADRPAIHPTLRLAVGPWF